MPSGETVEALKKLCRLHGSRCTTQRIAVYEYIRGNRMHPTVDDIWQNVRRQAPTITRESVFRIMMEFSEWGLVSRMDKIENARFDGVPENHGHFICKRCGAVTDFPLSPDMPTPAPVDGFQPDHVELRISGFCAACAAKERSKNISPSSMQRGGNAAKKKGK